MLWWGMYTGVTPSKCLTQYFTDTPDDIKSYVSNRIIDVLWLNVTAG